MDVVGIAEDGTEDQTASRRSHEESEFCDGRKGQRSVAYEKAERRGSVPQCHFWIELVPSEAVPMS